MSTDPEFTWRDYEDHIYEQLSEWAGDDARVEFNQKITGTFSGVDRQIDVLISGHFAGITDREITAVVDCKYYGRDIDLPQVDRFVGFLDDVRTTFGLLITNRGFTPAALKRANGNVELKVIAANIDRLPPVFHPSWDDSYYESDYIEGNYGGPDFAVIRHCFIDPVSEEYSFDPDNPPEQLDEVVLSGTIEELSWDEDEGRARCVEAILRHRADGADPDPEDVRRVVLELAYHWRDGEPWTLYDGQLTQLGL